MNFIKTLAYLIIIIFSSNNLYAQQFHTSNSKIDYEVQSGTLNITTRLFTAGLEKALGEKTTNKSSFESKLRTYINKKVDIKINKKDANISYYGFQTNDQTTRIYLKIEKITAIESLDIRLALLMDVYDDQQNFINVDIKDLRKSFTVRNETDVLKINL